jgi:hypothetical protein
VNADRAADYAASVADAYWGEVYGVAAYARIAAARSDPQERAKWETITELEVAMEARLRPLFERLGGDPNEHLDHWCDQGRADGARYGAADWKALMQRFSRELDDDIAAYRAIEDGCPPEDAQVLRWLTEHEVVAKSFVDAELDGRSDRSIDPVRRLIAELRAGKAR